MSAFNVVGATLRCPRCGNEYPMPVQFKYGDTWQYDYSTGDTLKWGGNDIGEREAKSVVVYGIGDRACPVCAYDEGIDAYVFVTDGRIVSVEKADGRFDFMKIAEQYIVLQK